MEVKVKAVRRRSQKIAEAAEKGLPPPPDDDDDDDSESNIDGPGVAMRPLGARKSLFPSVDSNNGENDERNGGGMNTTRRPTFMNPIEERESEVSNPMASISSKPSFMATRGGALSSDSDDGGVLGMVTQRRPTFTDSPERKESVKARPLSKLFAAAEEGEHDDETGDSTTDAVT